MSGDTSIRLQPYEVALLRGGPRAAVTAAVVALHLRGAVEAGRPGTMRTSQASTEGAGQAHPPLPPLPPLAEIVHAALEHPLGIRELERRSDVRQALAELRAGLTSAGLLRTFPPRRTGAARRDLLALYAEHPLPRSRKNVSTTDTLMAVALHGDPALSLLVPRFALRAGLIARAVVTDKGFHGRPRGGGTGGVAYSCGGGGGGTD
ncbi:TIGR04222 domain-containing membrane protein [Streptomyces sp. NPDC050619]|uniref:TIGR04222 domain-containing membrane protein n=1 Tax=Streptomyces sp. NPDC050619 TaxID=3157214 RepID=UPI003423CA5A